MDGAADEEILHGGVANAGLVVRVGPDVLRPSNPHTASIHRFLTNVAALGVEVASVPVGVDPDGRERLRFVPGEVAVPPYPEWVQFDDALASIARLIRRLHDASERVDVAGLTWSDEMVDPEGGPIVAHNDVCLENVVFRDGEAVALLDFDFAAPGRRGWDLARFAGMCIPLDDDTNATRLGWEPADRPARLRVIADAYGLDAAGRSELLACIDHGIAHTGEFVRRHVDAGEPAFIEMWQAMGGDERFTRRRAWWASARPSFVTALEPRP